MKNILTIDVEDWYQGNALVSYRDAGRYESRIEQAVDRVLSILDGYHIRATFFVLGHLAESHSDVVRRIHEQGHEIATHGYSHELAYRQERSVFIEELHRSITICEDLTGQRVLGHRASNWSVTDRSLWVLDAVRDAGLQYDSSVFPMGTHLYGMPGRPRHIHRLDCGLTEVPPSTIRFAGLTIPFSGGFFLRALPYWFIRRALRRVNAEGQPAVVYLHPWELDTDQPRNLPIPFTDRMIHYMNLHTTERKLRGLCESFSFGPVCEVVSL
jgi:polysaccharide deacetylase family protein (PEP-CTERM system associated)